MRGRASDGSPAKMIGVKLRLDSSDTFGSQFMKTTRGGGRAGRERDLVISGMVMDPTDEGASHVLSIRPTSEAIKKAQRTTAAPSQAEVRQQVQQGVQQALTSAGDLNNIKILAQQGVDLATKAVDALSTLQGG
eukprot:9236786-Pyramimonas_sp.AAC.1